MAKAKKPSAANKEGFLKQFGKNLSKEFLGIDTDNKNETKTSFWNQFGRNLLKEFLNVTIDDKKQAEETIPDGGQLPKLQIPQKVANKKNATFDTISNQISSITKVVEKIGISLKNQQDLLIEQNSRVNRINKERLLETKTASLENDNNQDSISVLSDIIVSLAKQIQNLSVKLNQNNNQGGDLIPDIPGRRKSRTVTRMPRSRPRGAGPWGRRPSSTALEVSPKTDIIKDTTSRTGYRYTSGSIDPITGKSRGGQFAPKQAQVAASTKLAEGVSKEFAKSAAVKPKNIANIKNSVRKIAAPVIAKGLGKTALKSIPILGAVAGVGFAVDRLVRGDVLGSGLDLVSGLAGPFTAIPALVASITRDVYTGVYGTTPENDPAFSERFKIVNDTVTDMVKAELSNRVEPRQKPTQKEVEDKTIPAAPAPQEPPMTEHDINIPGETNESKPVTENTAVENNALTFEPKNIPVTDTAETSGEKLQNVATFSPNITNSGTQIMAASEPPTDNTLNMNNLNPPINILRPQKTPTISNGRTGIGIVPNPDYIPNPDNLGTFYKVMFFNLNYQEQ